MGVRMASNYGDAMDALTESDTWVDAGYVAGGYLVPAVGGSLLEGTMGVDLPNELYGVAGIAGSEMVVGERMMTVGSGLYTVDALAQRFGLKNSVTSLGGGA